MNGQTTNVVVIGAGYAGLLLTARLAGKTRGRNVTITLVNASDTFTERLRLHQYAANQTIQQRRIEDVLRGSGVAFIRGYVTALDAERRVVRYEDVTGTRELRYDVLVYALGSAIDRDGVPGVRDYAYALSVSGLRSAETLRTALPALDARKGQLVVVGAGATGIEAAAEFAESYPNLRVRLVTRGEFGAFTRNPVAAYMHRSLTRLGIAVQGHTTVVEVRPDSVVTATGAVLPADLCLWTGGFAVPPLARETGLTVNERGQILIDPFMRSISHPDIYAVGDAAHPLEEPGNRIRMSAFAAVIMGAHAADCLSAEIRGKPRNPLSFATYGQGIALGRHDAIGFNTYPDDQPYPPYLTGRLGYEFREFFVRFLAQLPALERRWPGFFFWVGRGRYAAQRRRRAQRLPQSI